MEVGLLRERLGALARLGAPPYNAHTARIRTRDLPHPPHWCNRSISPRTQRSSREPGIFHSPYPNDNYLYHHMYSHRGNNNHTLTIHYGDSGTHKAAFDHDNQGHHPFGLPSQQATPPAAAAAAVVEAATAGGARSGRTVPSSPLLPPNDAPPRLLAGLCSS